MFRHKESALTISVRDALRTRGDQAKEVILSELMQMIQKSVWTPVRTESLTEKERSGIIRSSMFLKEKFLANGEFEKLKARLVADGNMQDRTLYEDLSAPKASTCSVFGVLAIAAKQGRCTAVIDIGGAFLQAKMTGEVAVYMRLDRLMTAMLTQLDASYESYVDKKGRLTVRLDRALYGCVESASLWYEHLAGTLTALGYV